MKVLKMINLIVGIVLIILLLVAGVYLRSLLKPVQDNTISLRANTDCDLGSTVCVARLQDKSLSLQLSHPVRYLQKIQVMVSVTGFEAQPISGMQLDFSMPDMEMGINRFSLSPSGGGGVWRGMAMLPVCTTGRTDWQVRLSVMADGRVYQALYRLTVNNTSR